MKLKYSFDIMELEGRRVAVNVGDDDYGSAIKLTDTGAAIFEMLKEDVTEQQIVENILSRYDVPRERAEKDVHAYIEKLRAHGVLTD